MNLIDFEQFKVKPPYRDWTFWGALATSLWALYTLLNHLHWNYALLTQQSALACLTPLGLWLVSHGYVRGKGAEAAGNAASAAPVSSAATPEDHGGQPLSVVHPPDASNPPVDGPDPAQAIDPASLALADNETVEDYSVGAGA